MRNFCAVATAIVVSSFALGLDRYVAADANAGTSTQKPVLELFTSQGCSSCPPADALLQQYIKRGDVIALSVAVDYWDRLGWKDSFGSAENSLRQRVYARGRGDGEVYTPQMVVNGRAHAVGSRSADIRRAVEQTNKAYQASRVAMSAKFEGDSFVLHLGKENGSAVGSANVMLAMVQDRGLVDIKHGENSGRQISYHNIVRKFKQIGSWNGEGKTMRIARKTLQEPCCESVVVLLQDKKSGAIRSAVQVRIP